MVLKKLGSHRLGSAKFERLGLAKKIINTKDKLLVKEKSYVSSIDSALLDANPMQLLCKCVVVNLI